MFVDYSYYQSWGGTKLTQSQFNKEAFKACNYITQETMTRIDDNSIGAYPIEIQELAKRCACDLAEKYFDYDQVYENQVKMAKGESAGIKKSEKSGQVSVEYQVMSGSSKNISDLNVFKGILRDTLMQYLGLKQINGTVWNLTSKVINSRCSSCCLF